MSSPQEITNQLFTIQTDEDFNQVALAVFHFQFEHNKIYKNYVNQLPVNVSEITHYSQIPFLPIEFFKTHEVICGELTQEAVCFSSSGTTGQVTSKHYVNDIDLYDQSFYKGFVRFYGAPSDYCILALLPNYLEREGSSLVYMFDRLIKATNHPMSGFYLHNYDDLIKTIEHLKQQGQKTVLLGVTYALLDLAESNVSLSDNFIVMETGGMKGKRPEMIKEELHQILKDNLHIHAVHSEYGMTELLSQAYSKQNGLFECPPWMRVMIREINDPFQYRPEGKSGGINVIDLANLNSCSFIETKDLGKSHPQNRFEILGRFDHSDIRGCNLMIE